MCLQRFKRHCCFLLCRCYPVANKRDRMTSPKLLMYTMRLIDSSLACYDHWNAPCAKGASNQHSGAHLLGLLRQHNGFYESDCVFQGKRAKRKKKTIID